MPICQRFDLVCDENIGDFAIYQGVTYECLTVFVHNQDLSSYTPIAQIRDNFAEDGGNVLATFSFALPTFGEVTLNGNTFNATVLMPTLTAAQTELIPSTLETPAGTPLLAGVNGHVYDIKLVSGSRIVPVSRGFVQVIRDVSRI